MNRKNLARSVCAVALSLGVTGAAMAQNTANGGGATLPQPTYQAEFTKFTNSNPGSLFSYDGVGSGAGQTSFLNDDITQYNVPTAQYGSIVGSTVHFAASDAFLVATQLTNPAVGGYARSGTDGPLIQLPMIGVPITVPFVNAGLKNLILKLTDAQLCGVFSGQITNWNQLDSKATPGPITVVYRSDGSGTSFLFTQHLGAVCTSANSSFPGYPVPTTKTFSQVFTNFSGGAVPANFVQESGSSGVTTELLNTPLSIGYLSPDYTSIAPKSANTTSLHVASLINGINNVAYQPTVKNTELGLQNPGPNSTNATPPSTKAAAQNPLNWVPAVPQTNQGYPIVGYTTWEVSSCYQNKTIGSQLIAFLTAHYQTSPYKTILTNNGFSPLQNTAAADYVTAVAQTFLNNQSGYNLNIDANFTCKNFTGR